MGFLQLINPKSHVAFEIEDLWPKFDKQGRSIGVAVTLKAHSLNKGRAVLADWDNIRWVSKDWYET